jgi:DNA-binding CsgD family transcriptional regulator/PAS domain-containing protein
MKIVGQRDRLFGLIEDLYAAPGSEPGWLCFLDHLCAELNGSGASFISVTSRARHANVSMTVRTEPRALAAYHEHWGALDPWGRSPKLTALRPATVVLGDELISHAALKQTPFYCDFGRSWDIVRSMVGIIETGAPSVSVIAVNGTERRGAFDTQDSQLLTALMPHLQRGLQLHRRLLAAETLSDNLSDVIDASRHALILVNAAGEVTFMNRAATLLMAKRDGLSVDAKELRAARSVDRARLRSLIADAAATSRRQSIGAGGVLALGRPSGHRPLIAVVSPLSRRRSALPSADVASALVVVSDPENRTVPSDETLRALFTLTPAEAVLARLLATGMTPADAAMFLGVRVGTARTRMKAIFEKTNTHRQSDLIRSLLNATHAVQPVSGRRP